MSANQNAPCNGPCRGFDWRFGAHSRTLLKSIWDSWKVNVLEQFLRLHSLTRITTACRVQGSTLTRAWLGKHAVYAKWAYPSKGVVYMYRLSETIFELRCSWQWRRWHDDAASSLVKVDCEFVVTETYMLYVNLKLWTMWNFRAVFFLVSFFF